MWRPWLLFPSYSADGTSVTAHANDCAQQTSEGHGEAAPLAGVADAQPTYVA